MSTPPRIDTPANPHPERAASNGDLNKQILLAEQRLIAREEHLRRGIGALQQRVVDTVRPWQRMLPLAAGAVAVGGLAGVWGLRRARRAPYAASGTAADHGGGSAEHSHAHGSSGGALWVRLIALGWPLLPATVRSRVSPATTSAVAAIGLPLLEWLAGGRRALPLLTMREVDLVRFSGTWYEVAHLPSFFDAPCDGRASVDYQLRSDGNIELLHRCARLGQPVEETVGVARAVPGSGGARLKLSLWPSWLQLLPMAWSEQCILHVDGDYSEALVGNPARNDLRLLSRRPWLAPDRALSLVQMARDRGFAVERLKFAQDG